VLLEAEVAVEAQGRVVVGGDPQRQSRSVVVFGDRVECADDETVGEPAAVNSSMTNGQSGVPGHGARRTTWMAATISPVEAADLSPKEATVEAADLSPREATVEAADLSPEEATVEAADLSPEEATVEAADLSPEEATVEAADLSPEEATVATSDASGHSSP
jgi:hypothetical protein